MSRLLCDLKVAELRNELEKRGVDKSGVKPLLMERLKEIILKEGFDPSTFNFKNLTCPGANLHTEGSSAKEENFNSDSAVAEMDTSGRPESHLTSVSEGSIGAAEVSEMEDKTKEDVNDQPEDTATFVVRVGENEEDLDYDIKDTSTSAEEHKNDPKAPADNDIDSEVCTNSKQTLLEKQAGKSQPIKTGPVCEQAYLRVSNLKMPTKAVDLKQFFSAHGRVVSGKILASTRDPRGCVGFLKMASAEDAAMCIKKLDGTEFNCKIIKIEATNEVPSSIAKTPKNGTASASVKVKSIEALMASKSRRYRGEVGNRTVSSRLIESEGNVGYASPYERSYRPSARNMIGHYRESALITSHLARSLRRAQNFMHPASNSASASAELLRIRHNRVEADDAADDAKRSHFKIPRSIDQYYKKVPALVHCEASRIRYDDLSERQLAYENRYDGMNDSRSIRKQKNESYPVPSEEAYYRRGSRYASPQDETSRRPCIKPVVYRRPPPDRLDEPIGYADDDNCCVPSRHRMRHSSSYEGISSGGNVSNRFGFYAMDYKEHFGLRESQRKSHQSSNRNSKGVYSLLSSMASDDRKHSWRVTTSPALRRTYSRDRSRSPQIRTGGGLSMSRSSLPLPPPVRYTRRSSPLPFPPPFVAPHRRRSNFEISPNIYSRRGSGDDSGRQGYSYTSGGPTSSRDALKDSHIIDYGHRPSSSKIFPDWQPSSRPQDMEVAAFPRGDGSGYPTQWRSPEYYSRQQTRN